MYQYQHQTLPSSTAKLMKCQYWYKIEEAAWFRVDEFPSLQHSDRIHGGSKKSKSELIEMLESALAGPSKGSCLNF